MNVRLLPWLICFLVGSGNLATVFAQDVVVSEYVNELDPRDERLELLVIKDNTDMRNWDIVDNNSTQTAWNTPVTFNNIPFWQNLRAGTIIVLWNRQVNASGSANPTIPDTDASDGYIELNLQDPAYFNGGAFGSAPTWGGNSFNFAAGGDLVRLRDGSANFVHALGHRSSPGTSYTGLPSTPKLNHNNGITAGESVRICPGATLADWGSNSPQNGSTFTSKGSTLTIGFANSCGASSSQNQDFWRTTREPQITNQSVIATATGIVPNVSTTVSFSWAPATDPNPTDGTQGYIVLFNTTNNFPAVPYDGHTYVDGENVGGANVLAHLTSSSITSFSYTTTSPGGMFFRVYAYRYTTDNLQGNDFIEERGRAYNTTNFVTVNSVLVPLSFYTLKGYRDKENKNIHLQFTSLPYAQLEISTNGIQFEPIADVSNISEYSIHGPSKATYIRLKAGDTEHLKYSNTLKFSNVPPGWDIFPNPTEGDFSLVFDSQTAEFYDISIVDIHGQRVWSAKHVPQHPISISDLPAGLYFVQLTTEGETHNKRLVKL